MKCMQVWALAAAVTLPQVGRADGLADLKDFQGFTFNKTAFFQIEDAWGNGHWSRQGEGPFVQTTLKYRCGDVSITFAGGSVSAYRFDTLVLETGASPKLHEADGVAEVSIAGFKLGMDREAFACRLDELEGSPGRYTQVEAGDTALEAHRKYLSFKTGWVNNLGWLGEVVKTFRQYYDELNIGADFREGKLVKLWVFNTIQN